MGVVSTLSYIEVPLTLVSFLSLAYLTDNRPNKRIKFTMKLWKWIALLIFVNVLGYGLVLWDMYDHKVDNVTFNGVGFKYFLGHVLVLGPGIMVFYVANALLCIIVP